MFLFVYTLKWVWFVFYLINQNLEYFFENIILDVSEILKCLECKKEFINILKYKFIKYNNQNITIKKSRCKQC